MGQQHDGVGGPLSSATNRNQCNGQLRPNTEPTILGPITGGTSLHRTEKHLGVLCITPFKLTYDGLPSTSAEQPYGPLPAQCLGSPVPPVGPLGYDSRYAAAARPPTPHGLSPRYHCGDLLRHSGPSGRRVSLTRTTPARSPQPDLGAQHAHPGDTTRRGPRTLHSHRTSDG